MVEDNKNENRVKETDIVDGPGITVNSYTGD